jgi:hypothetical protein
VSVVSGPICTIMPADASKIEGIRAPKKRCDNSFFDILLCNQG